MSRRHNGDRFEKINLKKKKNAHRCQCRPEVVGPMCTGRKWSDRPDKGAPGTVDGEAAGETSTGPPRSTTDNRLLPTQNTKNKKHTYTHKRSIYHGLKTQNGEKKKLNDCPPIVRVV